MPLGIFGGIGSGVEAVVSSALPILILALFPRLLASAMLGARARDGVATVADVRPLVGRCAGVALFVSSMGRAVMGTLSFGYAYLTGGMGMGGGMVRSLMLGQVVFEFGLLLFLGFLLAFGPVIRENFRAV